MLQSIDCDCISFSNLSTVILISGYHHKFLRIIVIKKINFFVKSPLFFHRPSFSRFHPALWMNILSMLLLLNVIKFNGPFLCVLCILLFFLGDRLCMCTALIHWKIWKRTNKYTKKSCWLWIEEEMKRISAVESVPLLLLWWKKIEILMWNVWGFL